MIAIQQLKEAYEQELNELEQNADATVSEEQSIQEKVDMLGFCIDLSKSLKVLGIKMTQEDFSAQSEAIYFDVNNGDEILKLRIASHSSSYDKDINVEMNSFLNYSQFEVKEAAQKVKRAFKTNSTYYTVAETPSINFAAWMPNSAK